jgi:hypothetical protein
MTDLSDELAKLAELRAASAEAGTTHTTSKAKLAEQQELCLGLMLQAKSKTFRHDESGILFTRNEKRVKGQVDDRRRYVRYCLEQDAGVAEFLDNCAFGGDDFDVTEAFYDLLVGGLEMLSVTPKQDKANALARQHINDEAPLPPGLNFRPDPYIQQRGS